MPRNMIYSNHTMLTREGQAQIERGGDRVEIRKLREAQGLTQTQIAHALDIQQCAVAKWETRGACPNPRKLPMLADLLCCSIDALYGREWPPAHHGDGIGG